MNKLILSLLVIVILNFTNSCNRSNRYRTTLAEKIEYDVQIKNNDPEQDWWVKNIEDSKREAFLKKIFDGLSSGKLKAYNYNSDEQLPASSLQLPASTLSAITKLRFTEKWYINTKTLAFEKKVLSVCPLINKDSTDIPLFRIKLDTNVNEENMHPVSERIQYDVDIKNSEPKTQNSKLNWWTDNIETSKREKFIDLVLASAFSGKFRTYDYFNSPMNAKQLKKEFYRTDTVSIVKTTPPYDRVDTIRSTGIDKKEITRLRFLEEWYLSDNPFAIIKKVKGINPIIKRYDENNDFRGYQPMFWIYTDEKYPIKQ